MVLGMKTHTAVYAATELMERVVPTAANEHNLNTVDSMLTEPVGAVFADAGYCGAESGSHCWDR